MASYLFNKIWIDYSECIACIDLNKSEFAVKIIINWDFKHSKSIFYLNLGAINYTSFNLCQP